MGEMCVYEMMKRENGYVYCTMYIRNVYVYTLDYEHTWIDIWWVLLIND